MESWKDAHHCHFPVLHLFAELEECETSKGDKMKHQ